jgi:mRNA interferase MazF
VIIAMVPLADSADVKMRPALVLFKSHGNVVIAGITSNLEMDGIPLLRAEGAIKDSVIKLNYIFTISEDMVHKIVFHLNAEKRKLVRDSLVKCLDKLLA